MIWTAADGSIKSVYVLLSSHAKLNSWNIVFMAIKYIWNNLKWRDLQSKNSCRQSRHDNKLSYNLHNQFCFLNILMNFLRLSVVISINCNSKNVQGNNIHYSVKPVSVRCNIISCVKIKHLWYTSFFFVLCKSVTVPRLLLNLSSKNNFNKD